MLLGENGYINKTKKSLLRKAILFFLLVIVIFVLSELIQSEYMIYFKVLSALLILPVALFMAKYFTYMKQGSNPLEEDQRIRNISKDIIIYSELTIIRARHTIFFEYIAVSDTGIVLCKKIGKEEYDIVRNKEKNKAKEVIADIVNKKGLDLDIVVCTTVDDYYTYLNQEVKGRIGNMNLKSQEDNARAIISCAI